MAPTARLRPVTLKIIAGGRHWLKAIDERFGCAEATHESSKDFEFVPRRMVARRRRSMIHRGARPRKIPITTTTAVGAFSRMALTIARKPRVTSSASAPGSAWNEEPLQFRPSHAIG